MRRILPVVFTFFFFLTSTSNLIFAQSETGVLVDSIAPQKMILPPRPPDRSSLFGQNHSYSVVLRGNGEAVITLKVALSNTNPEGNQLEETTLRLPARVKPSDISVYQIIAQGYCVRHAPIPYNTQYYGTPACLEYSDPDYFNYYGGGKYLKAKYEYTGDTLTVILLQPIAVEKSGAFFVHFRTAGYAKKNIFGAYKYDFESLKTEESVNQMNIGINTDSDLYLKGAQGEVEYRSADTSMMLKEGAVGGAAPAASSAIDRVISQVGYGAITKTASNLAALESYKVSGMYADSRIKLYGKEIFIGIFVILVFALVVLLVIRKVVKSLSGQTTVAKKTSTLAANRQENVRLFLNALGISFTASLVIAGYTTLVLFILNSSNYIDYRFHQILQFVTIIFSFGVYSVLLFVPGVFYGYKKGFGWGVTTVVLTLVWLFVYFVIGLAFVFFFGADSNQVMPVMGRLER